MGAVVVDVGDNRVAAAAAVRASAFLATSGDQLASGIEDHAAGYDFRLDVLVHVGDRHGRGPPEGAVIRRDAVLHLGGPQRRAVVVEGDEAAAEAVRHDLDETVAVDVPEGRRAAQRDASRVRICVHASAPFLQAGFPVERPQVSVAGVAASVSRVVRHDVHVRRAVFVAIGHQRNAEQLIVVGLDDRVRPGPLDHRLERRNRRLVLAVRPPRRLRQAQAQGRLAELVFSAVEGILARRRRRHTQLGNAYLTAITAPAVAMDP